MSSLRRWWANALLFTIGLTGLFLFLAAVVAALPTAWAQWLPLLFCWGSIVAFGAVFMAAIGFATNQPRPEFDHFWDSAPWALIGGIAAFCIPLSEWLWSCCYQGDMYYLACFGPLLFLMGLAIGGWAGKGILTIIAIFLTPFIYAFFQPITGDLGALVISAFILLSTLGITLYWRSGPGPTSRKTVPGTFTTYPGDNLNALRDWPRYAKEALLQSPPPWLAEELAQPKAAEAWLADSPDDKETKNLL